MTDANVVSTSEVWKDVLGFEGKYQVSNKGNVRGKRRLIVEPSGKSYWREAANKKLTKATIGYYVVGLWQNNKVRLAYVHELVAESFIGPRPAGLVINHISGIKTDNDVLNLEYITHGDNIRHAIKTGLSQPYGESNGHAILNDQKVLEIRALLEAGSLTHEQIGKMYGVGRVIISNIKARTRWKHL